MNLYQKIWLLNHPGRTREWLELRIAEGFEIHHADCDHSNNAPDNLVLIEIVDHHKLHGRSIAIPRRSREINWHAAALAYHARRRYHLAWADIAKKLDIANSQTAERFARVYASITQNPWPLVVFIKKKRRPYKRPTYRGY